MCITALESIHYGWISKHPWGTKIGKRKEGIKKETVFLALKLYHELKLANIWEK